MSEIYHDEIEIEDFDYDEDTDTYTYPCPCGDRFEITKEDLQLGEEVATCPSCSLVIRVIYDKVRIYLYVRFQISFIHHILSVYIYYGTIYSINRSFSNRTVAFWKTYTIYIILERCTE